MITGHSFLRVLLLAIPLLALSSGARAHGTEKHDDAGISVNTDQQGKALAAKDILPEEIASIGGPFSLINQFGEPVTEQTYAGKHMLVFFGYSNCQIMCSISLKRMGDALTLLEQDAEAPLSRINPLVITVDPANDTPARLRESLLSYHPSLTGLTGTLEQLKPVYKAYRQKPSILDMELSNNPIVSHSSYFYLMGPDGKLQTFFPPVLSAESMAELLKKYLAT